MKIRVVHTASKAKAVQVIRYQNNKRVVMRHIGSAHSETGLKDLLLLAEEWNATAASGFIIRQIYIFFLLLANYKI